MELLVRVFMLGWEFPPMVSGGLGVACYGLAKALNGMGVDVLFVLPKPLAALRANGHGSHGGMSGVIAGDLSRPGAAGAWPTGAPRHGAESTASRVREMRPASTVDVRRAVEQASAESHAAHATDRGVEPGAHPDHVASFFAQSHGQSPAPGASTPASPQANPAMAATTPAQSNAPAEEEIHWQRVTFVPIDAWLTPYMTAREYQQMVVEEVTQGSAKPHADAGSERSVGSSAAWTQRAMAGGAEGHVPQPPNAPDRSWEEKFAAVRSMHAPAPLAPRPGEGDRAYIDQPGDAADDHIAGPAHSPYAGDLFAETERYARLALTVARGERFGVVHAHDWMTFEAAMAVAAAVNKPLVLQIHSTELDRAGAQANRRIMEAEKLGMMAADRIVAVSYKTKTQLIEKYGIDPRKIEVVYNATDAAHSAAPAKTPAAPLRKKQKTVLFLGRLTEQKGPDYFLRAAKKVLSIEPDVKFVVGGKGDLLDDLKALADELGIKKKVLFTGFLKKDSLEKAFKTADVYVMPSLSEPFGIAPLEALTHDVPVIISRQSGVAEVLRHVLKVDFWDTDDLANKILAVLHHPPLAQTLKKHGQDEVRLLSWDDSARRIAAIYEELAGTPAVAG